MIELVSNCLWVGAETMFNSVPRDMEVNLQFLALQYHSDARQVIWKIDTYVMLMLGCVKAVFYKISQNCNDCLCTCKT